jgi:[acyl-carrier-protein] S-malonyltransferase
MEPAASKLAVEADKVAIKPPRIPVVTNVNAGFEESPDEIKSNLVIQVKSSVLWEDSIKFLSGRGIKRYIEVGPGKVLAGLLRRIDPALECLNVEASSDVLSVKDALLRE